MKVSDILKKVSTIGKGTEILIVFRESKDDDKPEIKVLKEDTTDDETDQVIRASDEYTVQEMEIDSVATVIYAIRAVKRTPKPKPEKAERAAVQQEKAAELDQAVEDLKQAVAELVQEVITVFQTDAGRVRGVFRKARAAVARFLKKIFRKGDFDTWQQEKQQ